MNGNPSSPNDTSYTSVVPEGGKPKRAASAGSAGASPGSGRGTARGWPPRMFRPDVLRAYWLSPAGLVILAATGVSLALRLFMLSRPQFLTGVTEYDDGVYLGGAIRLISGSVPYHGFAFVQPPGILLLMAPVAVIAQGVHGARMRWPWRGC